MDCYTYSYRQLTYRNLEVNKFSFLRKSTKRKSLVIRTENFHNNTCSCLLELLGVGYLGTHAFSPGPSRGRGRWSFLLLRLWWVIIKYHDKALILPDFLLMKTIQEIETRHWVSSNLSWFASLNNKAFGNLFCNSEKSFHTSPRSSDSNNRGYRPFFKLNNGICIYKKS